MHETAIIEELFEAVEGEMMRGGPAGRVRRVRIAVGRLSGASPEALGFAFDTLSPGTLLAGAELLIAEPKAICRCNQCAGRTETDDPFGPCPRCGGTEVSIEGANEIILESIEADDPPPSKEDD